MPTPAIIFDDGRGLLSPLTDLRAAFEIRTGVLTTIERLQRRADLRLIAWSCPGPLQTLLRERSDLPPLGAVRPSEPVIVINGRCPLLPPEAAALPVGSALLEQRSGDLIAARVEPAGLDAAIRADPAGLRVSTLDRPALLARPWHVRSFRDACIAHDLALLAPSPVTIAPTAKVHPSAILDAEAGPIFIDEHAVVRPGAIICGPAAIGPHSTVLDRGLIRPGTVIGPRCKVAGEIGGTIFQGLANKAHDGHLGDSYVGEWANLGAGTTNSNLLNTYGEVICRAFSPAGAPGPNERTGEQFLGAVIGDHAKLAICTRIMTGAIIGTGTMWAASAPITGTVPRFSWVTDAGSRTYAMPKFLEVAQAAMARRGLALTDADRTRLLQLAAAGA